MTPTFDAQIIHWPTLAAFVAYLQGVPRPAWCKGLTNHNTYIPNETQWRGMASMRSMMATYIAKGWTAGPQLYLCATAPNPADTGIWQMTPLAHQGVHAGACNVDHLGIENVGDFNAAPPSKAQYTLLLAVNRALLTHWGLPPASVNVHNECMAGRTCPGKYLTGTQIRNDLQQVWPPTPKPPIPRPYRLVSPCTPLTARDPSAPLAAGVVLRAGDVVNVGDVTNGWLWVSDKPETPPGIGFIPASYAKPV